VLVEQLRQKALDLPFKEVGEIVEINNALDESPEQLNQDAFGAGWIFVVEMSDPSEIDALMDAAAYRSLVEG
jgi:glycine cleavage system H protein